MSLIVGYDFGIDEKTVLVVAETTKDSTMLDIIAVLELPQNYDSINGMSINSVVRATTIKAETPLSTELDCYKRLEYVLSSGSKDPTKHNITQLKTQKRLRHTTSNY